MQSRDAVSVRTTCLFLKLVESNGSSAAQMPISTMLNLLYLYTKITSTIHQLQTMAGHAKKIIMGCESRFREVFSISIANMRKLVRTSSMLIQLTNLIFEAFVNYIVVDYCTVTSVVVIMKVRISGINFDANSWIVGFRFN